VVRQSGGGLRLKSAVGTGTTVELYLPRSLAQVMPAAESPRGRVPPVCRRRARVLVVDDNEEVREVIVAYLDTLGCPAIQAASGRTALEFLADNPGAIDLLMADYAMPGMSGIELIQAVRAKCPALPAIIVTGYADTSGFDGEADAILLKKPFRMNELAATVELALARRTSTTRTASTVIPLRAAKRR
jgi:CheY-like chemotaxis protein